MPAFSGSRLRAARRAAGLSADALAETVARSASVVWSYEEGRARPPVDVAAGLAAAVGVTLDELLDDPLVVA
ncbi:helix-turn-helix domain-containing protein [Actinacidiphila acidipaludis]|uniref:Helix-turn-helix domain-containing protein n=1 Tax=Actinacidiphila acidipaludis TaxID=2873382 RepID=A0ABS7Q9A8_9ACTN|nr:helix-turn-helix domain-containing protein [Streptomyces acidipaludis]MBY8879744.1 helix-turn-helix domain-containing protein [Streptomyces acidipaludis]